MSIGLVAYRDHGDQYVTQVLPLTNDLDKVYSTLMDYQAVAEEIRLRMSAKL